MASEKKDRPVLAAGAVRKTAVVKSQGPVTFDMKYLAETDAWIANQVGDDLLIKRHMDGLIKIKVSGGEIDKRGMSDSSGIPSRMDDEKIGVAILKDYSGSMGTACDSELTRYAVAIQNEQYLIKTLPAGTSLWSFGFATEVKHLDGLYGVVIPDSEQERKKLCELVKMINVGQGTAIHDAVETSLKEFRNNSESLIGRKISKLLVVVFTDGADNASRFSWNAANYKADKGASMIKSLDHLFKFYIEPLNKKGIKVELAFHGISSGADWNILKVLNDYPKFNSGGRVIENDGRSLVKGFQTYINNFMRTVSTNNQMMFMLDDVSDKAGVKIRILDPSEGLEPGQNDYGSKVITSPWQKTSDFRMLGDFSRGKEYSVMFQILTNMQETEEGKYRLAGFPEGFSEIIITAELSGDRVPGMISGILSNFQIKIPIVWDAKVTKFNQVQSKWQLRLEKHWIAIRSMMTKLFDMVGQRNEPVDTKKVFEMIGDEINAIKKDQDQCYRDGIHEDDAKAHDELRLVSPFYDPPEMNPEVACFTRFIEDLRIMETYFKHASLQPEARAKMFEYLLPERRGASATTVFNSLFLADEQFTEVYKQLVGQDIKDEGKLTEFSGALSSNEVQSFVSQTQSRKDEGKLVLAPGGSESQRTDDYKLILMNKFALVAKQAFKDQQLRKDREYNRDTLVAFANLFLANGITHEEIQQSTQATKRNTNMARARYIKRGERQPTD